MVHRKIKVCKAKEQNEPKEAMCVRAHAFYLEMALWNASIVVIVAFGAHYVKGIMVSQEYSWLALYSRGKCRN